MKKIYYLSSCDTCMRILKEISPPDNVVLQDIKTSPLTKSQLEKLRSLAGSYEALFSRRARLYQARGLHKLQLSEAAYATLLLEHYTFLKRPVVVSGSSIFIGNTKKAVNGAKESLHS